MWKKTFIRSTLIILVALAGIFVFATTHNSARKPVNTNCIKSSKECCSKSSQNDFLIWESMSRAIVANAQF